jgi:hypothetical protein
MDKDYLRHSMAESGSEIEALYKTLLQMHASDGQDDDFSLVRVDFR